MAEIGFIGVGNMGGPMARNLMQAGHGVAAFDMAADRLDDIVAAGATRAASPADAATGKDVVFTMLPAGEPVKQVYFDGVLDAAAPETLLIDCSTIDMDSARAVHEAARAKGFAMLDAPVSGGVAGATAGTLTFMVGGPAAAFDAALPLLQVMGGAIVHCGEGGAGQAAKICNNMMLGVQMSSVAEAFVLAERLGLSPQKLFEVSSRSSGQCWSLTSYCPIPGPVPSSPANRDYAPGFAVALMLKDMELALDAAVKSGAPAHVAAAAADLYRAFAAAGGAGKDFSAVITAIRDRAIKN